MSDETTQARIEWAMRSTNLTVSDLQVASVMAEVEELIAERQHSVEMVLIENRRGTTNQMWLWDRVYGAIHAERPPHDAEMAAARDADRVAGVAKGGGL